GLTFRTLVQKNCEWTEETGSHARTIPRLRWRRLTSDWSANSPTDQTGQIQRVPWKYGPNADAIEAALEKKFSRSSFIHPNVSAQIATQLSLTVEEVDDWFCLRSVHPDIAPGKTSRKKRVT
ncbi:hypothetical protein PFISCL1PPCAC_17078, partial [Pristionchus fissidentatus]